MYNSVCLEKSHLPERTIQRGWNVIHTYSVFFLIFPTARGKKVGCTLYGAPQVWLDKKKRQTQLDTPEVE
jgi:hypothetical protein